MRNEHEKYIISLNIPTNWFDRLVYFLQKHISIFLFIALSTISISQFIYYYNNHLGLAYNDARSHLDIGRRVVEGLKPGLAQLGSVWLPLPHLLMVPTIWNDFMWHSGLAGAIISMISFVVTGMIIYKYLDALNISMVGKLAGVIVWVTNLNVLYLQSTAMTELLLIATMTIAAYELMLWHKNDKILHLIKSAMWIMFSTLARYDGWFLLAWGCALVAIHTLFKYADIEHAPLKQRLQRVFHQLKNNYFQTEGTLVLFGTLASFGIMLWLLWNALIFKDPLYFAFGPFSAKAQQDQLQNAGVLQTKHNLWLSVKFYIYALVYNSGAMHVILGVLGLVYSWFDKRITKYVKYASTALIAPFFFNILALYMGHSVLFIQGLSGDTWFNVRYGIMLMPAIAIFIGYLFDKAVNMRIAIAGLLFLVTFFQFVSFDAVTIDDARVGSSQKNVSEVSGWLYDHALNEKGFVLISAASHDAIIFSSGLPMKRFIHEGTGLYWQSATALPDRWARWIIMRTYDDNDLTWKAVKETTGLEKYNLVGKFPFADIYEIKPEYIGQLNTDATFNNQK